MSGCWRDSRPSPPRPLTHRSARFQISVFWLPVRYSDFFSGCNFGIRISVFRFRISTFGFRLSVFRFLISVFGFRFSGCSRNSRPSPPRPLAPRSDRERERFRFSGCNYRFGIGICDLRFAISGLTASGNGESFRVPGSNFRAAIPVSGFRVQDFGSGMD